MRGEGVAKMGYYPTPESQVGLILDRLEYTGPARLFDPCCGEGLALEQIATFMGGMEGSITYGIELDMYRANEASVRLNQVVRCGYESARVDKESMQLLFLNPPYDNHAGLGGTDQRTELRFLRGLSKYVAPDGILVFIIPRYVLSGIMVDTLVNRYTDLAVYQFDDDEYQVYKQVVVFGRRRSSLLKGLKYLSKDEIQTRNALKVYGESESVPMPLLNEVDGGCWVVPSSESIEEPILFRGSVHDPKELREDLLQSDSFSVVENMLAEAGTVTNLHRPLLPFRRTHMATLISAGALNGAIGIGENRHMVIGMSRKHIERDVSLDDNGNETIIDTEKYVTAVRTIEPNGRIFELE